METEKEKSKQKSDKKLTDCLDEKDWLKILSLLIVEDEEGNHYIQLPYKGGDTFWEKVKLFFKSVKSFLKGKGFSPYNDAFFNGNDGSIDELLRKLIEK